MGKKSLEDKIFNTLPHKQVGKRLESLQERRAIEEVSLRFELEKLVAPFIEPIKLILKRASALMCPMSTGPNNHISLTPCWSFEPSAKRSWLSTFNFGTHVKCSTREVLLKGKAQYS